MDRTDAIAWVLSVCAGCLRLSQLKTLSILVGSAVTLQRISLANIGRGMIGRVKHQIKRCWRFCANERIETADAMRGVVKQLLRRRKKPLLISFDWTDIKGFQTLMAAAVFKGRCIPLCWASCEGHTYTGHRSRNAFEESLLLVLRSMIPKEQAVILVADRGFGRTELARFCQRHGFHYVIRINPDVWVEGQTFRGKLLDYPVHKGICTLLRNVAYRQENPVTQNVVVRWVRNLPKDRDECWFLMTDLTGGAGQLSGLYARRMSIEELFRDSKNKRNGWSLRDTQITRADRLDRLLLILALAYLLLCGIGLVARGRFDASEWCSSTCKSVCSVFTIGRIMFSRFRISPAQAFAAVQQAIEEVIRNWG
jgi:hypothetical protein